MQIFLVFSKPDNADLVRAAVERVYPDDYFDMQDGRWLVADAGTAKDVFDRLSPAERRADALGQWIMIISILGYWGVWSSNVWEWISAQATKVKRDCIPPVWHARKENLLWLDRKP